MRSKNHMAFLLFAVLASAVGITHHPVAQPPAELDGAQHRGVRARTARARTRTVGAGVDRPSKAHPASRSRDRSRYGEHAGVRALAGDHPQRADGDRAQQPHAGRARDGPRGVADDRPHARLHRGRAPVARRCDHRLRHHAAHDPAALPAGRHQPAVPSARVDLRAVRDHARRAARCSRRRAARARRRRS